MYGHADTICVAVEHETSGPALLYGTSREMCDVVAESFGAKGGMHPSLAVLYRCRNGQSVWTVNQDTEQPEVWPGTTFSTCCIFSH
jgi:hypothetical protein